MKHGTIYTYRKKRCRCSECRAAHAENMRGYWDRRRARTMTSRADLVARIEELEHILRCVDECLGDGCYVCHEDMQSVLNRGAVAS